MESTGKTFTLGQRVKITDGPHAVTDPSVAGGVASTRTVEPGETGEVSGTLPTGWLVVVPDSYPDGLVFCSPGSLEHVTAPPAAGADES